MHSGPIPRKRTSAASAVSRARISHVKRGRIDRRHAATRRLALRRQIAVRRQNGRGARNGKNVKSVRIVQHHGLRKTLPAGLRRNLLRSVIRHSAEGRSSNSNSRSARSRRLKSRRPRRPIALAHRMIGVVASATSAFARPMARARHLAARRGVRRDRVMIAPRALRRRNVIRFERGARRSFPTAGPRRLAVGRMVEAIKVVVRTGPLGSGLGLSVWMR